jgi:hypothetical protein
MAKAEWDRALTEVAALHQSIDALTGYLAAREASKSANPVAVTRPRRRRRSRTDVLAIMSEDGIADREWTVPELVAAFAHRKWSLHMANPDHAVKNMLTRLVTEDKTLERVRPGVYRVRPDVMDRLASGQDPAATRPGRPQRWTTTPAFVMTPWQPDREG